MPGFDPFSPDPIVLDERESTYTGGEMHALIAPLLGIDAGDIEEITILADTSKGICFGGSRGRESAKMLLVNAVMSGILNS